MLPLRISLQGFMSYRDHTVFDFGGARLWMLSGANGAGKSTVFDALRWVLFGVHRGGRQHSEQLIHHELNKLQVEIELQLGDTIYKLKRTLGRNPARATWDVSRRVGEAWESEAGTSMATGYNEWISANIGLTDEAFCASVYLSQNRADAILSADADARYDLLSQLVDLGQFERWHTRADHKRSLARTERDLARRKWELSPSPEPGQLDEMRAKSASLGNEVARLESQTRELDAARADATRWEDWSASKLDLESQAQSQRALLDDTDAIERGFARLQHLETHGGALEVMECALLRRDELAQRIGELKPRFERAGAAFDAARSRAVAAGAELGNAQEEWTLASGAWSVRMGEVAALEPERAQIKERAALLSRREEQTRALAEFPGDLDARAVEARADFEQAREAGRALPLWRRFENARRALSKAKAEQIEWMARFREAGTKETATQNDLAQVRARLESASAEAKSAGEEAARVREQARAIKARRADFARVEGDLKCHFCGQELSPEHRAAEVARLNEAALQIEGETQRAKSELGAAQDRFSRAQDEEQAVAKLFADAGRERDAAALQLRHQEEIAGREEIAARQSWDDLGIEGRADFGFQNDFARALSAARPDEADFRAIVAVAARAKELEQTATHLQVQTQKRDAAALELERLNAGLAPLLGEWDDARVEVWQARADQLQEELQLAKTRFDQGDIRLQKARARGDEATQTEVAARNEFDVLTRQIGPLEGQLSVAQNAVGAVTPAFNAALSRDEQPLPNHSEVQALREEWALERRQLEQSSTQTRHAQLIEARTKLADIEARRDFFGAQIESLSPLSRQPRREVEASWNGAKAHLLEREQERKAVEELERRIEHELRERGELEIAFQQKDLEHARWEELALLLGPHQLQRHLLRRAEAAIVREANRVLNSVSGGTLRLELVPDSDEPTGNKRPKVLDVVCFHETGGELVQAIAPVFLSGSQRFRVAVALALGIGRTAARGSGNGRAARVETILIDEGFGGLDKTGRDEMKDELRELGRELGRVILVSHQEDFAGAFPNRFEVSLEQGVSRVRKMVE